MLTVKIDRLKKTFGFALLPFAGLALALLVRASIPVAFAASNPAPPAKTPAAGKAVPAPTSKTIKSSPAALSSKGKPEATPTPDASAKPAELEHVLVGVYLKELPDIDVK